MQIAVMPRVWVSEDAQFSLPLPSVLGLASDVPSVVMNEVDHALESDGYFTNVANPFSNASGEVISSSSFSFAFFVSVVAMIFVRIM